MGPHELCHCRLSLHTSVLFEQLAPGRGTHGLDIGTVRVQVPTRCSKGWFICVLSKACNLHNVSYFDVLQHMPKNRFDHSLQQGTLHLQFKQSRQPRQRKLLQLIAVVRGNQAQCPGERVRRGASTCSAAGRQMLCRQLSKTCTITADSQSRAASCQNQPTEPTRALACRNR